MNKTKLVLLTAMLAVSFSVSAGKHDKYIHGHAFNGNTTIQTNNGNNNGGNLQTGGNNQGNNGVGNGNGGPNVPAVPLPGALVLFGSAILGFLGFLGISRNKRK